MSAERAVKMHYSQEDVEFIPLQYYKGVFSRPRSHAVLDSMP